MPFRDHVLLGLAAKAPHCMNPACRKANRGDVVASHSNLGSDGKGLGIKASDAAVAFLCSIPCHHGVDQGKKPYAERQAIWEAAHRASLIWLIESGHLVAFAEPQPLREPPPPKPKRKISKGKPIASRGFEKPETPRKIAGAGFSKTMTRGFNGKVKPKKQRQASDE